MIELDGSLLACHLCSFAHACEGRSLQAGTPEIAIATYARPCGIGRRSGLPWGRLIPRVGMLTTTGPLGTAQARQPSGGAFGTGGGTGSRQGCRFRAQWCISLKSVIAHWELLSNSSHAPVSMFPFQSLRHRRRHGIAARVSLTMPVTRSQSAGADDAAHPEEVDTSATSGFSEQTAAAQRQAEVAQRQEARMKHLEDLLLQQAAASRETQVPTLPAPVVDVCHDPRPPAYLAEFPAPPTRRMDRVSPVLRTESPLYIQGIAINTIREVPTRNRYSTIDCIRSIKNINY
uniref:Uncharacterized protein n=1 Tax=Ananas comosus var. bracteatus TaxID=296719 RepID=A0A6V7NJ81_ANACO|nr:unnamed protein product [Ananas comosus var. bracteatus]